MSKLYLMDLLDSNPNVEDFVLKRCPACGEMAEEGGEWLDLFPDFVICPRCARDLAENFSAMNLGDFDRRLA